MTEPIVSATQMQVTPVKMPTGEWYVQIDVEAGILKTSILLPSAGARTLALGLVQKANEVEKKIVAPAGVIPPSQA